ncbi:hypothetical protein WJX74_000403 [Apatococcus lobatus]|uniref:Peptidase S8/S53 domain-containing protein n=2 Tax=Apatococcus TaxID=904362 RepID=A0AAW1SV16_9CHLO
MVIRGFAAQLTEEQVTFLEQHEHVHNIAADSRVTVQQSFGAPNVITQAKAGGNLDRIDQPSLPLDGQYHFNSDGTGTNLYIVDTGIKQDHQEFQYSAAAQKAGLTGSRARPGFSALGDGNTDDCLGHGTHVAGIAAGLTVGIARNATVWSVRAFGCDGDSSISNILLALDWLPKHAQHPAVAVLALGSNKVDQVLDTAVAALITHGIIVVVAAGNVGSDACQFSPGRLPQAITVAASTSTDTRWQDSNFGSCVSLFAPGANVRSAYNNATNGYRLASGTSMAAPLAAGVAALHLQRYPDAAQLEVKAVLTSTAIANKILDGRESPNLLLQSDLDIVPNVLFHPARLPPAILYSNTAAATSLQSFSVVSEPQDSISFQVDVEPDETSQAPVHWLTALPAQGRVPAQSKAAVTLHYDFQGPALQGIYSADVLITTSGTPAATVMEAVAYVFCQDLQGITPFMKHKVEYISFPVVQTTRPTTSDWPALTEGPHIYADVIVRFSHPVAELGTDAVLISSGAGQVERIVSAGSRGDLCSDFAIHAKVPVTSGNLPTTTMNATILGGIVTDVFGLSFPNFSNSIHAER